MPIIVETAPKFPIDINPPANNNNNNHQPIINAEQSIYYAHDNGGRPFKVVINHGNSIQVFKSVDYKQVEYTEEIVTIASYSKVFIGDSTAAVGNNNNNYNNNNNNIDNTLYPGNSILVENSPLHYTFIGESVYQFVSSDNILHYHSPVGNNDVPYPYAVGEKITYLFVEKVCVPSTCFNPAEDIYDQYWTSNFAKQNKEHIATLTVNMLQARL